MNQPENKIDYSKLPIFKKGPNTADKDPWWADFKKAQTKTYKCRDCDKVLISKNKIDLSFFWVRDFRNDKNYICSACYLKKLEAEDPVIKADFFKYHYFEKKETHA